MINQSMEQGFSNPCQTIPNNFVGCSYDIPIVRFQWETILGRLYHHQNTLNQQYNLHPKQNILNQAYDYLNPKILKKNIHMHEIAEITRKRLVINLWFNHNIFHHQLTRFLTT